MNNANTKPLKNIAITEKSTNNKVIMLNISQFELTKILYSSGILAECDLTPSAKLFLWALCSHYNPNNETMFPSQQTVAKKLGISEKSAQRAVKELKSHNLIDYETKRVNHYVFGKKFFELVKMSGMIGQNVLKDRGQNVRLTNNKEKKEQTFSLYKKGGKSGIQNGFEEQNRWKTPKNNDEQNKRTPNTEETRKLIEEKNKVRKMAANPSDFSRKEAQEWLKNMPEFWLKKSKVAKFLIEKYELNAFKQAICGGKEKEIFPHSNDD